MRVQTIGLNALHITDTHAPRLDPITVVLRDIPGRHHAGQVIVECYGLAWSAFFGSIGERSLVKFLSTDPHYLAGKLGRPKDTKADQAYLLRICEAVVAACAQVSATPATSSPEVDDAMVKRYLVAVHDHLGNLSPEDWEAERADKVAALRRVARIGLTAALAGRPRDSALELIGAERQRQVDVEGWTPAHDDEHDDHQLSEAAAAYALGVREAVGLDGQRVRLWPWDAGAFKPTARIRDLVKAGALIVAEIERLQRATAPKGEG